MENFKQKCQEIIEFYQLAEKNNNGVTYNDGVQSFNETYPSLNSDLSQYTVYQQRGIDWTRVPVDTDVIVNDGPMPLRRKFALFLPSLKYPYVAFDNGYDSKRSKGVSKWLNCELADNVEIKEEWYR